MHTSQAIMYVCKYVCMHFCISYYINGVNAYSKIYSSANNGKFLAPSMISKCWQQMSSKCWQQMSWRKLEVNQEQPRSLMATAKTEGLQYCMAKKNGCHYLCGKGLQHMQELWTVPVLKSLITWTDLFNVWAGHVKKHSELSNNNCVIQWQCSP